MRATIRVVSFVLFWAALLIQLLVSVTGGFDLTLGGVVLSAHDPIKPLKWSMLLAVAFFAAGGRFDNDALLAMPGVRRIISLARFAWLPAACALLLSLAACVYAYTYGSKAAGGADSWGYLSQSELMLNGTLHVDQTFVSAAPWPDAPATFAPLGYAPKWNNPWSLVPTYSPGLPLLFAGMKAILGEQQKFLVVPLLTGCLVLACYGIGRRLASPAAGVLAAFFTATSPIVLFMCVVPMSDVPAAAGWACAFFLALGTTAASAAAAGVVAGVALLIRPNLLWLAGVIGLRYAIAWWDRDESRRTSLRHGLLFSVGVIAAATFDAFYNATLFGSPFVSGYGRLTDTWELDRFWSNLHNYVSWLLVSQTPLAFVGIAALFIPDRRLWPGARHRYLVLLAGASTVVVWAAYQFYIVFGAWWFTRFLLPSWPFMMAGCGAICAYLLTRRPLALRMGVLAVLLVLCADQVRFARGEQAFDSWRTERRYIRAGQMAGRFTDANSVLMSMQHSGSIRYYGGRMTLRYDLLAPDDADAAVDWLSEHGSHVYLLAEDWEIDDVKRRFAGTRTVAALTGPPVAAYDEPGHLYLFDVTTPRRQGDRVESVSGVDMGLTTPGPVTLPRVVLVP